MHLTQIRKLIPFHGRALPQVFESPFDGPHLSTECENHKSARDLPEVVRKKVAKEFTEGRILLITSRFGVLGGFGALRLYFYHKFPQLNCVP